MILQALNSYYQRLLERGEEGLSPFGYSPEKISYEILLSHDGRVVDVNDIRDTSGKKPVPRVMTVPQPAKRTANIEPNFLWDKTSYVFGVSGTSKRSDKEHDEFKRVHRELLAHSSDPALKALLAFLSQWVPDQFQTAPFNKEMLDANFVFRMDGEQNYLHERPAAQAVRAQQLAHSDKTALRGVCLVTGKFGALARLHAPIKGVKDTQTNGASIAAFNADAYLSYLGTLNKATAKEKENNTGASAPVSIEAAFAYTTVLNHLLRRGEHNRQRLQIGDASVVFWAEAANAAEAESAELTFAAMLNEPPDDSQEAARVQDVLQKVAKGRPLSEVDPRLHEGTRMFVLGLAPNASRISIRFWLEGSLGVFVQRLSQHEQDLRIEPVPWRTAPSVGRLALETAPARWNEQRRRYEAETKHILPQLTGDLMRAVLSGGLYPRSLLANTVMRIRTDGNLSGVRAAICKGVLAREQRMLNTTETTNEEVPVSLDKESMNPGYRLGRLFAVLEAVQRNALGGQVNATIRDRYYGAASATPASVFPVLLRNTQNHLGKLRKEKPGLAVTMEKDIHEIVDGLSEHFPRNLRIEDQGRFAIGYYHQSQSRFVKGDASADTNTHTTDSNAETTEGASV